MLVWLNAPTPRWERYVLLDRDGVLNLDRSDFVKTPAEYRFYEDALEALRRLRELAVHPIIISNQSGLGRGIIASDHFWEIHQHMKDTIQRNGGELFAAFYCPHVPEAGCTCRKPSPGMILTAAELFSIQLRDTFFIGDRSTDCEAALRAGCQGILLNRADDSRAVQADGPMPPRPEGEARIFPTLLEAVESLFPPEC